MTCMDNSLHTSGWFYDCLLYDLVFLFHWKLSDVIDCFLNNDIQQDQFEFRLVGRFFSEILQFL